MKKAINILIKLLSLILPLLGTSQSLDQTIDLEMEDYYYGKNYCNSIDSLIAVAKKRTLEGEEVELYGLKALCFSSSTERDSIEFYLSKLKKGKSDRSNGLSKSLEGYLLSGSGEDERAIQHFLVAMDLYDPKRDSEFIILTHLAVAWGYYGIFAFDQSLKHGNLALDRARKSQNSYNIIESLDVIANSYTGLEDSLNADRYFKEYLSISKTVDNSLVRYWSNTTAGHHCSSAENYDSAHFYFQLSLNGAVALNDSLLQFESLMYIGENAQMNNANLSAIKYLTQAKNFPNKYHRPNIDRRIFEYLAEAHKDLGDYNKAYHYLNKYKEIDDAHWNNESREMALDFEAKYQSLQKDSEITKQELQISKRTAERNIILGSTASLSLLTWFLFYRNMKNKRISVSKIENLEKQQKLLALDYMVQGQEEERKRIAQDLHDGLGGLLSSAKVQMQTIQQEIDKLHEMSLFNKAERMIDHACTEVRRIAHDMMPSALIDLGLVDAVEDLIGKLAGESELQFKITYSENDLGLNDISKVQLYRVIQEVINNTIKHAGASSMEITFNQTALNTIIEINENGKGFDVEQAKKASGLGLKNIESRISYINGTIVVTSHTNKGTNYIITIPK